MDDFSSGEGEEKRVRRKKKEKEAMQILRENYFVYVQGSAHAVMGWFVCLYSEACLFWRGERSSLGATPGVIPIEA